MTIDTPAPAADSSAAEPAAVRAPRRVLVWVVALTVLAAAAVAGAAATERYQKSQVRHAVPARAQVERFGDHDTYVLVWNDEIFANLVPMPEGMLAQYPGGARLRVYYQPVTQQVVLRSRRYDAPQLLLVLAGALLIAALTLLLRSRRWQLGRRFPATAALLARAFPEP